MSSFLSIYLKDNRKIIYIIVAAGILLRLFHFFDNRSLWEDELYLASSLLHMDFMELATLPLDYEQRAPLGFLWAEHAATLLFGVKEMALRVVPLLSGIIALLVFVPVSRFFLRERPAIVAITILAFAPPLVYHAVEAKQYSTEMMATILSLYLYIRCHKETILLRQIGWGIAGAVITWFSFASIFILSGLYMAGIASSLLTRDNDRAIKWLLPAGFWLMGFASCYVFFVGRFPEAKWLSIYWQNRQAFAPLSLHLIPWLAKQWYSVVYYPLGLTWYEPDYTHTGIVRALTRMPLLPMLCWVAGIISLLRKDFAKALALSFPVLITIAASAVGKYPLQERLIVFLAPILILFVAAGCEALVQLFREKTIVARLIPTLLIAPLLLNTAWELADTGMFGGYKRSYQRQTMLYLQDHVQKNEVAYIYWNEQPGYNYYSKAYHLSFPAILGSDQRNKSTSFPDYYNRLHRADLTDLANYKAVWLVYKNFNGIKIGDIEGQPDWYYKKDVNAVENLKNYFSTLGTPVQNYRAASGHHYSNVCTIKLSINP